MLNRLWGSQNMPPSSEGSTFNPIDLWRKSPQVKYLTNLSENFISSTVNKFETPDAYRALFLEALELYTTGTDFNIVLLLMAFLPHDEQPKSLFNRQAEVQLEKVKPKLLMCTRLMAHLTANCVFEKDLVVYRGFTNKRRKYLKNTLKEQQEDLAKVKDILDKEKMLSAMLRNSDDLDYVLKKHMTPNDLRNPEDFEIASSLRMHIKYHHTDLDLVTRDVEHLVATKGNTTVGNAIQMETFMSTSLAIETARRFIDEDRKCCMLAITIPAGTPGFFISPYSEYSTELEVVLPPCAQLVVTGQSNGVTKVRYTGISDIAKKRMTLDLPRIHMMQQFLHILRKAKHVKNTIKHNIGLFQMCKRLDGSRDYFPIESGKILTTFSNDDLQDTWNEGDNKKFDQLQSRDRTRRKKSKHSWE